MSLENCVIEKLDKSVSLLDLHAQKLHSARVVGCQNVGEETQLSFLSLSSYNEKRLKSYFSVSKINQFLYSSTVYRLSACNQLLVGIEYEQDQIDKFRFKNNSNFKKKIIVSSRN